MSVIVTGGFSAEHDPAPTPEQEALEAMYERMSAFVSEHGPKLLTRGMHPLEANEAIMACLEQLKQSVCQRCGGERWVCENHPEKPWNSFGCECGAGAPCVCSPGHYEPLRFELERVRNRLALAERIIDELPAYVCGMAVLSEEGMQYLMKEWDDARDR